MRSLQRIRILRIQVTDIPPAKVIESSAVQEAHHYVDHRQMLQRCCLTVRLPNRNQVEQVLSQREGLAQGLSLPLPGRSSSISDWPSTELQSPSERVSVKGDGQALQLVVFSPVPKQA